MKKDLNLWQFVGFAVTSLGGTLLHFLYEWTNQNRLVAPFSAVNESTWEHMKLLFLPMFFFAIIQKYFFKDEHHFWCIKFKGISLGLILIPVIFYTYNGVFGKSPDWINIAIFFVAAAISYLYETKQFKTTSSCYLSEKISLLLLLFFLVLFIVFTFFTPKIAIFQDPLTKTYGVQ